VFFVASAAGKDNAATVFDFMISGDKLPEDFREHVSERTP
jgi:hypothetical protein